MGFDDLLADRKAEAGILAERLMRAVGVETLENLINRIGIDARPIVVDNDLDLVLQPPAVDAHGAADRRERARIGDQVVDNLTKTRIVAGNEERLRRAALEIQGDGD